MNSIEWFKFEHSSKKHTKWAKKNVDNLLVRLMICIKRRVIRKFDLLHECAQVHGMYPMHDNRIQFVTSFRLIVLGNVMNIVSRNSKYHIFGLCTLHSSFQAIRVAAGAVCCVIVFFFNKNWKSHNLLLYYGCHIIFL